MHHEPPIFPSFALQGMGIYLIYFYMMLNNSPRKMTGPHVEPFRDGGLTHAPTTKNRIKETANQ